MPHTHRPKAAFAISLINIVPIYKFHLPVKYAKPISKILIIMAHRFILTGLRTICKNDTGIAEMNDNIYITPNCSNIAQIRYNNGEMLLFKTAWKSMLCKEKPVFIT